MEENVLGTQETTLNVLRVTRPCFLKCEHSVKVTQQYFPVVLFIMLYKVVLTFESVDEILKCDHSNESY